VAVHSLLLLAAWAIVFAFCRPLAADDKTAAGFQEQLDIAYQADGEATSKLDVYLHPSSAVHRAIVYVHGGGFVTGDKRPCPNHILGPALKHGYSVVSVNYRLAPQHPFPAAIEDVSAAVRFVKAQASQWRINPDRLVLTGESAGGLISALTGAKLVGDDQVAAVMPMYGEVDLELRVSENPCAVDMKAIERPPGGCISNGLGAFLGFKEIKTDADRATIRAASTVAQVHDRMPPYLLIHGTRDFGVPFEQSVSLEQAMKKRGQDCTLLPVVGGGHGNWTPDEWQEVMNFAMRWLDEKLADR
jgi:acetyl esterase/lipase